MKDGILVRTIESARYQDGTEQAEIWDFKDDKGITLPADSSYQPVVLDVSGVTSVPKKIAGNTARADFGKNVFQGGHAYTGGAVFGSNLFLVAKIAEGSQSVQRIPLNDLKTVEHFMGEGSNAAFAIIRSNSRCLYMADNGLDFERVSRHFITRIDPNSNDFSVPYAPFAAGESIKLGETVNISVIDLTGENDPPMGLAVNDQYIVTAHPNTHEVRVFRESDGLFLYKFSQYFADRCDFHTNGDLLVISGPDIRRYQLSDTTATYINTPVTGGTLIEITCDKTLDEFWVYDYSVNTCKKYNLAGAMLLNLFPESYQTHGPKVSWKKCWASIEEGIPMTFIAILDNHRVAVGDGRNRRTGIFSYEGVQVDRIAHMKQLYSVIMNPYKPNYLYPETLRYRVNYYDRDDWELEYNYSKFILDYYGENWHGHFHSVFTLGGRECGYLMFNNKEVPGFSTKAGIEFVIFADDGGLLFTGILLPFTGEYAWVPRISIDPATGDLYRTWIQLYGEHRTSRVERERWKEWNGDVPVRWPVEVLFEREVDLDNDVYATWGGSGPFITILPLENGRIPFIRHSNIKSDGSLYTGNHLSFVDTVNHRIAAETMPTVIEENGTGKGEYNPYAEYPGNNISVWKNLAFVGMHGELPRRTGGQPAGYSQWVVHHQSGLFAFQLGEWALNRDANREGSIPGRYGNGFSHNIARLPDGDACLVANDESTNGINGIYMRHLHLVREMTVAPMVLNGQNVPKLAHTATDFTILKVTYSEAGGVLSWAAVPNAESYLVMSCATSHGTYEIVATVNAPTHTVTGINVGAIKYFEVRPLIAGVLGKRSNTVLYRQYSTEKKIQAAGNYWTQDSHYVVDFSAIETGKAGIEVIQKMRSVQENTLLLEKVGALGLVCWSYESPERNGGTTTDYVHLDSRFTVTRSADWEVGYFPTTMSFGPTLTPKVNKALSPISPSNRVTIITTSTDYYVLAIWIPVQGWPQAQYGQDFSFMFYEEGSNIPVFTKGTIQLEGKCHVIEVIARGNIYFSLQQNGVGRGQLQAITIDPLPVNMQSLPKGVADPIPTLPVPEYPFAQSDSTINRVDRSKMTTVNVNTETQLHAYLAQDLVNTQLALSSTTVFSEFHEQTGAWDNVEMTCLTGKAKFARTTGTTALILQGNKTRNRVAFTNLAFSNTSFSSGYPLFWWNDLPFITGLEIAGCTFSCPNGLFNALGCVQYSTASNTGNFARDIYIHDNAFSDIGRMGIELLSQGYDIPRLFNVTIDNNTFSNLGLKDEYGMAFSLSGLIRQIGCVNNTSTGSRKVAFEFVNVQDVVAVNNSATSTKDGVGYGISDDDHHTTRNIFIKGGTFDMEDRPFYIYDAEDVHIDAQDQLWKGGRGVDMNAKGCTFDRMNVLVHSKVVEASWQFGGTSSDCVMTNSKVSSAGANAAGRYAAYESIVLRSYTRRNSLRNVTTVVGRNAQNQPLAGNSTGGLGNIIDQGQENAVTNNTYSTAP